MTPLAVERATIRAWPAAISEDIDGWMHLAASGITGRVNAVWPLAWRGADLDAAISRAESWCAAHNLPPRFKLTEGAIAPPDLRDALARRGYTATEPTLVMTCALTPKNASAGVTLFDEMPAAFDESLARSTPDAEELEERRAIARRAPQPAAFALIEANGAPAAIGMTALAGDLAGIFLMRTIPEARRGGHARKILRALLARAAELGATSAFLQVEAANTPAVALYDSEGFTILTAYRFWRKAPS